jgi:molybdopterin synthase sulfur carrier subunit
MQILYFAWLKGRIGCAEETLTPPSEVQTVGDLAAWLAQRSSGHAEAFKDLSSLKAALDQDYVSFDTPLGQAQEVAFFPPVTGG